VGWKTYGIWRYIAIRIYYLLSFLRGISFTQNNLIEVMNHFVSFTFFNGTVICILVKNYVSKNVFNHVWFRNGHLV